MKCSISVELHCDGQPVIWGKASDLSVGGCFVEMPIPLPVETGLRRRSGWAKPSCACTDKSPAPRRVSALACVSPMCRPKLKNSCAGTWKASPPKAAARCDGTLCNPGSDTLSCGFGFYGGQLRCRPASSPMGSHVESQFEPAPYSSLSKIPRN
ncbi:MAG: hypothetical protein DMG98_05965 [Acidobacteria bacterium]|nr:MAG: hypothetical protein DMG98_05965 [Acidobacteriota bacterium]